MSDILLGALIGIGGAIVGASITAFIAYINTKSQLNLRIYELRTGRLIRARERVLIPLREAMSQSLELLNSALIMMVRMKEAQKRGDSKESIRKEIQLWEEVSDKSIEVSANLEMLKGQVSDLQLYKMIEEAKIAQENENEKIIEITMLVNNPRTWNDAEALRTAVNELKEVRKRIFSALLPVNKRIEELLSGEPSN